MKKTNSKKGFTLVELVIVIAVIAILSAILVPTFSSVIGNANKTKEKADLKAAITTYIADHSNDGTDLPDFNEYVFVNATTAPTASTIPVFSGENATTVAYRYNNGEITEVTSGTASISDTDKVISLDSNWYAMVYKAA